MRPSGLIHDPLIQFGWDSAVNALLIFSRTSGVMRPGALFAQAREQNFGGFPAVQIRVNCVPHTGHLALAFMTSIIP